MSCSSSFDALQPRCIDVYADVYAPSSRHRHSQCVGKSATAMSHEHFDCDRFDLEEAYLEEHGEVDTRASSDSNADTFSALTVAALSNGYAA